VKLLAFWYILTRQHVCHGRILCQNISLLAVEQGKMEYCRLIYSPDNYVRGLIQSISICWVGT